MNAWRRQAACLRADPDQFYPEKGGSAAAAKRVCNGDGDVAPCPVRVECLQYALDNDERFGVWGGLAERERRKLARRLGVTPQRRQPPSHGTDAGYKRHERAGEDACPACLRAHADYVARWSAEHRQEAS